MSSTASVFTVRKLDTVSNVEDQVQLVDDLIDHVEGQQATRPGGELGGR
jgi:hypothetical protein